MRLEAFALRRAVRLVVIIIEAALADSDDTRMIGRLDQCSGAKIRVIVGLMWMDADAGPDVVLTFGQGDDVAPFALSGRDVEEAGDSAFASAFQQKLE